MKDYYKIGEISSLYNIGPDSLRYYEKIGILKPSRDKNGYRVYSIRDIWKLNVIKDLRNLNFPMKKIKEYLDNRNLKSTEEILIEEKRLILEKIEDLKGREKNIETRIKNIKDGIAFNKEFKIEIEYIEKRKALKLEKSIIKDEQIDFILKKLNKNQEDKLYLLGNSRFGDLISISNAEKGIFNLYKGVFFLLDDKEEIYDFVLEEGEYLTLSYRGEYENNKKYIPRMIDFAKKNNYKLSSDIIEICKIDIHETSNSNEFLTELQIKIEHK